MKAAIIIFCVLVLSGCRHFTPPEEKYAGKWLLKNHYQGDERNYTGMIVDSLQMKSTTEADVWVNGTKQTIYGAKLTTTYYPVIK